ncbi:polysaccharide pyruvyl transferase family protein [Rhizobium sp. BK251]|uniref:polysaccharide pyruvyl transferase family protein n=1 Tax=Rhizobium sp. BK251 TaxID=2512125 RepID=UPI0014055D8B|nr:polysaccharide pyruvyl transferase family protein [Rhizobium sp. BK251]
MSSDAEGEGLALELPRIRLFNVKYSPNLGDGLLSECLEKALIMLGASPDTWSIDLAARQAYGDTLPGRTQIMSMLDMLPNGLRQQFVRLPLAMQARRKWRPHYSSCLRGATAVVIGGGNLISDIDLNFPTKLSLAVEEAARLSLPFVVYASGVTSHWTRRGVSMLEKTFASRLLRGVFVRDHDSKLLWDAQLGQVSGFQASVVRDPALLVSQFIAPSRIHDARPPVAGVGIMSHIAIRYHASNAPDTQHLETWYAELVRELVRKGFRVAIFTNGSPEDVVYLARLRPRLLTAGGKAVCFPVQRTPTELCAIISSLDVLVAYRMHAVIAAYSYGVPAIGLAWDRKLRSFMSSVGCEEFLCDVAEVSPTAAADLACQAAAAGIAEEDRTQVMREAWQGISQLINLIGRVP